MKNNRIISIPYKVSDDIIDNVMCTALDTGINYWCNYEVVDSEFNKCEWDYEIISRGGKIKLTDYNGKSHTINVEKILKGIKIYIKNCLESGLQVNLDSIDSEKADSIIQFGIFGDILYG